jgi:hypothetical protein
MPSACEYSVSRITVTLTPASDTSEDKTFVAVPHGGDEWFTVWTPRSTPFPAGLPPANVGKLGDLAAISSGKGVAVKTQDGWIAPTKLRGAGCCEHPWGRMDAMYRAVRIYGDDDGVGWRWALPQNGRQAKFKAARRDDDQEGNAPAPVTRNTRKCLLC